MSVDPEFVFSQSSKVMSSYFKSQQKFEKIGTLMGTVWFFAGWFEDGLLFFFSMSLTMILLVVGAVDSVIQTRSMGQYSGKAVRRLLLAVWSGGMYSNGDTPGPDTVSFFDLNIEVVLISQVVIASLLVFWFGSRYINEVQSADFTVSRFVVISIRGMLRGAILAAFVYSLFSKNYIPESLNLYLFIAYIAEPLIYMFFSYLDQTISRADMLFGTSKLPIVALRESLLSNTFLILFTGWFKGIQGSEWDALRALYLLATIIVFVWSFDVIKEFNRHVLGKNALGQFLEHMPEEINDLNLGDKLGHVIDTSTLISVGKKGDLKLNAGSIVIPVGEIEGKIKAIIIGKGENIINRSGELSSQLMDGVSTAMLSKKEFKKAIKDIIPQRMDTINLENLELPSLETIVNVVSILGNQMSGWIENIKKELGRFQLSNYGISEIDGNENVILPGIKVQTIDDTQIVNVLGMIKVTETPDITTVRIGSWLNVVEVPKFTFVSLPGITVFDLAEGGSAVDIFGFKIGDGISADRLMEFKDALLSQLDRFESHMHSRLGRILADKDANALLSVSWDGEFKPLLEGRDRYFGEHPALGAAVNASRRLMPGYDETTEPGKIIELTGINPSKSPQMTKSTKGIKSIKGIEGIKRKSKIDVKIDIDIGRSKSKLKSVKEEMDAISEDIESIKKEMNGETEDDYPIYDADYEIVDDDDYEISDEE